MRKGEESDRRVIIEKAPDDERCGEATDVGPLSSVEAEKPPAVVAYIERDGKLLSISRKDTGEHAVPGGKCEDDEPLLWALTREVQEEAGVRILSAVEVYRGRHTSGRLVVAYRCTIEGEPVAVEEGTRAEWVAPEEIANGFGAEYHRLALVAAGYLPKRDAEGRAFLLSAKQEAELHAGAEAETDPKPQARASIEGMTPGWRSTYERAKTRDQAEKPTSKMFGHVLRQERRDARKTMEEVALCANVGISYVSSVEHDQAPPFDREQIEAVAELFGIRPERLLSAADAALATDTKAKDSGVIKPITNYAYMVDGVASAIREAWKKPDGDESHSLQAARAAIAALSAIGAEALGIKVGRHEEETGVTHGDYNQDRETGWVCNCCNAMSADENEPCDRPNCAARVAPVLAAKDAELESLRIRLEKKETAVRGLRIVMEGNKQAYDKRVMDIERVTSERDAITKDRGGLREAYRRAVDGMDRLDIALNGERETRMELEDLRDKACAELDGHEDEPLLVAAQRVVAERNDLRAKATEHADAMAKLDSERRGFAGAAASNQAVCDRLIKEKAEIVAALNRAFAPSERVVDRTEASTKPRTIVEQINRLSKRAAMKRDSAIKPYGAKLFESACGGDENEMLDLTDPDHRRTLREVIDVVRRMAVPEQLDDWMEKLKRKAATSVDAAIVRDMALMFTRPDYTGKLVQKLMERAGVPCLYEVLSKDDGAYVQIAFLRNGACVRQFRAEHLPAICSGLLNLDPEAGTWHVDTVLGCAV